MRPRPSRRSRRVPQDLRIAKRKPSCFFGTIFMSHLNFLDIDTLIMTGCTTSGCLRATAVDAYSFNFKVVIPEECAFDRFEASHAINLFDLNCKYADVVPVAEVRVSTWAACRCVRRSPRRVTLFQEDACPSIIRFALLRLPRWRSSHCLRSRKAPIPTVRSG